MSQPYFTKSTCCYYVFLVLACNVLANTRKKMCSGTMTFITSSRKKVVSIVDDLDNIFEQVHFLLTYMSQSILHRDSSNSGPLVGSLDPCALG